MMIPHRRGEWSGQGTFSRPQVECSQAPTVSWGRTAMGSGKVLVIGVIAGLALIGVLVALMLRPSGTAQGQPNDLARRLLAHSRDRSDYRLFVGLPPTAPTDWVEVAKIDETSVTLKDAR